MTKKKQILLKPGERFGRLKFIREISGERPRPSEFICDCGKIKTIALYDVVEKHTVSCGCYLKERQKLNSTHGHCKNYKPTQEYRAWRSIKDRCYHKSQEGYKRYGGRGIEMCDKWKNSFEKFLEDVGKKPSKYHSLDRINNDGNYEPGNVRWANWKEQIRNRSNTVKIEICGEIKPLAEWAEISGLNYKVIYDRIFRYGIEPKEAISRPLYSKK